MTGSYSRRRLPRVRMLGRDRHPDTGMPMTTLVCTRCHYACGTYLTTTWTYRPRVGWLCPACAARRPGLWARLRAWREAG